MRTKYEYAARHGFDVTAVRGRIAKDRPASWSKIPLCRQALEYADWLWWLDADAPITNPALDVRQYCDESADIVITADANGINCGSLLLRNSYPEKWQPGDMVIHLAGKTNEQRAELMREYVK